MWTRVFKTNRTSSRNEHSSTQTACTDKWADMYYQLHLQCLPKTRWGHSSHADLFYHAADSNTTSLCCLCRKLGRSLQHPYPLGHPQCPGSRSYRLWPSDIQYTVAEQGMCPKSWCPGNNTAPRPPVLQGKLGHQGTPHPTSKHPTDKYLFRGNG